jgi:hypothetical protein
MHEFEWKIARMRRFSSGVFVARLLQTALLETLPSEVSRADMLLKGPDSRVVSLEGQKIFMAFFSLNTRAK